MEEGPRAFCSPRIALPRNLQLLLQVSTYRWPFIIVVSRVPQEFEARSLVNYFHGGIYWLSVGVTVEWPLSGRRVTVKWPSADRHWPSLAVTGRHWPSLAVEWPLSGR